MLYCDLNISIKSELLRAQCKKFTKLTHNWGVVFGHFMIHLQNHFEDFG
jgi:hypothetical protein